jgi:non-homologous end joining protein Ku
VVIGQREKTIALRAVEGGIVAHTIDEQRDINDARPVFGDAADIAVDREMVQLAKQLRATVHLFLLIFPLSAGEDGQNRALKPLISVNP